MCDPGHRQVTSVPNCRWRLDAVTVHMYLHYQPVIALFKQRLPVFAYTSHPRLASHLASGIQYMQIITYVIDDLSQPYMDESWSSSAGTGWNSIHIWALWFYRTRSVQPPCQISPIRSVLQVLACNTDQWILMVGRSPCCQNTINSAGRVPPSIWSLWMEESSLLCVSPINLNCFSLK